MGARTVTSQSMGDLVEQRKHLVACLLQPRGHTLDLRMTIMYIPFEPLIEASEVADDLALLL